MPAKRNRVALKAALLAPAGPVVAWGVQKMIAGEPLTGAVAVAIGMVFVAGFIVIQEYDLPYEQEIIDAITANQEQLEAENVTDVSEDVADRIRQETEDAESDTDR